MATEFADLRKAITLETGYAWVSVELLVWATEDGGLDLAFFYNQPRPLRGLLDKDATAGHSPTEFAAWVLTTLAGPPDVGDDPDDDDEFDYESPVRTADARPSAVVSTTWVCIWCKQTYTGAKQPTSFQPNKCPRNPGKAHAWHK